MEIFPNISGYLGTGSTTIATQCNDVLFKSAVAGYNPSTTSARGTGVRATFNAADYSSIYSDTVSSVQVAANQNLIIIKF